jgi:protoheme IX farnesyltransferase
MRAYVALTKPRIIELLLVTTVPTMVLAERGLPSAWLVLATIAGGTLAAGSANAVNCWADRDIDALMQRTAHRPLARHQVPAGNALRFGVVLGVAATALLTVAVNALSAALAVGAILFYVFVYTLGLKRRTAQNIVIGGAAGAFPVLIGWTAVTGGLGLPAWILFGIVFAWTPPHFWALAMRYRDDYARAGVPMLPVVASARETTLQILGYTLVLVSLTLMLGPVAGLGLLYLVAAIALGGWFLGSAWRLYRNPSGEQAMRVFRVSISYLGLLFAAMAIDAVLV